MAKTLAERLGHDPSVADHVEDLQDQINTLTKRVAALETLADEKEGRPSEAGHTKVKQ